MKCKFLLLYTLLLSFIGVKAQDSEKACPALKLNLATGKLNNIAPTASIDDIKQKLPCFTGESKEGGAFNCGGGLFYLNDDVYFYTGNDYIEVRKNFKGTINIPILGLTLKAANKALKKPKPNKMLETTEYNYAFYNTSYGCLVLGLQNEVVTKICLYYGVKSNEVELCL